MLRLFFLFLSIALISTAMGQLPHVSAGKIVHHANFPSRNISPRNVDVWLPSGYTIKKKYAVLYMHDGQMLFDSTNTWNKQEWGVDETISSLLKNKQLKDCIVVGIWSVDYRWLEYLPAKPFKALPVTLQDSIISDMKFSNVKPLSDQYLRFIVTELKPFIDKTYPTLKEKENTYIAGSSMGGLISLYAVCEYPNVFGGAACLSTHWPVGFLPGNREGGNAINKYLQSHLPSPANHRFYFDYGTGTLDSAYESYQQMIDFTMTAKGYDKNNWITLRFSGADHSEKAWRSRLAGPMYFLLRRF